MKPKYQDILDLTPDSPTWYDQNGAPRYCEFHPSIVGGQEVVLLKIECASCRKRFLVEMSKHVSGFSFPDLIDCLTHVGMDVKEAACDIPNYGDPPRHDYKGNRCAGEVMTCDDIKIMQFWRKDTGDNWERVPEYEIYLVD